MTYAKIDPQIGYIQGMNIVCSVLLYHDLDIYNCIQVMKFLMIACGFRQVYLSDFELAHKLSASLAQALKYRCSDLYRHLVCVMISRSTNTILTWEFSWWDGFCRCWGTSFH